MASLFESLMDQIGNDGVRQMSRQLGADEGATAKAVQGALPMLMGALSGNASDKGGAEALLGALSRDHDGSILDDVGGFLGKGDSGPGQAILGHVLGSRQPAAAKSLGQASGLDAGSAGQLLGMLAPLVMGALGREQKRGGLDVGALTNLLGGERRAAEQKAPDAMGMLGQLLDADGDGSMVDDVAGMVGKLFGGKR
jgi:hypothetical protein